MAVGQPAFFVGCDVGDTFDAAAVALGNTWIVKRVFHPVAKIGFGFAVQIGIGKTHRVAPRFAFVEIVFINIPIKTLIEEVIVTNFKLAGR